MEPNRWQGSLVALVTPFTTSGDLDLEALNALLSWHQAAGTAGVVLLGTTGEAATLTLEERTVLINVAREALGNQCPLIVGTGAACTRQATTLTQHAFDHGADACLVVTPFYNRPPQAGMLQHFETLADQVQRPIWLYNVPSRTGVDLHNSTVLTLAEHPWIQGLKDATGELDRVVQLRASSPESFALYSGDDGTALTYTHLGGDGVISVLANALPSTLAHYVQDALDGARKDWPAPWHAFLQTLSCSTNPIPIKQLLSDLGWCLPRVRSPLVMLSPEDQHALIHATQSLAMRDPHAAADVQTHAQVNALLASPPSTP